MCREKYKLKEREEVWHKIEELARQNPQVDLSPRLFLCSNPTPLPPTPPPSFALIVNRWQLNLCACFLQSNKLRPGLHPQEEVSR